MDKKIVSLLHYFMVLRHRKQNRLRNFNYSSSGYYFITICTENRQKYFGDVINNKIILNQYGEIVNKYWLEIQKHYNNVELDEFQIMPNHVHGIIINVGAIFKSPVKSPNVLGEINFAPTINQSVSNIMKWFKSISTIEIRKTNKTFKWQRSFYDHIIRNEYSLFRIRQYIEDNPKNWHKDRNNLFQ